MTDIVERLRHLPQSSWPLASTRELCAEAADEIERLRVENEQWQKKWLATNEAYSNRANEMAAEIERQRDRAIWLQEQLEEFQKATT